MAAITKYHRLGGLNNKHLLLTVLEAGKSKLKVLADSVCVESHFLDIDGCLLPVTSHGEKGQESSLRSLL